MSEAVERARKPVHSRFAGSVGLLRGGKPYEQNAMPLVADGSQQIPKDIVHADVENRERRPQLAPATGQMPWRQNRDTRQAEPDPVLHGGILLFHPFPPLMSDDLF
ncbi:MAG: hypothetical protein V4710_17840, partial [Verrucomicrobiota bacterium]